MTTGALVLPLVIIGITEASANPQPFNAPDAEVAGSTTARSSVPARHVLVGCQVVEAFRRIRVSRSKSLTAPGCALPSLTSSNGFT